MYKRLLYLGYFLKSADYRRLSRCMCYVKTNYHKGLLSQSFEMLHAAWQHGASFEDYYDFRAFKGSDRNFLNEWITTGRAYEFHTKMNHPDERDLFQNKVKFFNHFREFIGREFLDARHSSAGELQGWLERHSRFVAKPVRGVAGRGVKLLQGSAFNSGEQLEEYLRRIGSMLLEEQIVQHEDLTLLNPSSVNTIRLITVTDDSVVHIIGAILRIGVGSIVDNLSSGGIAAPVNPESGVVVGPAVTAMPDEQEYATHPMTGTDIVKFRIPHWSRVTSLIEKAATQVPQVRTVGWDVAVTQDAPILVEGNDNWGKRIWQITHGRGMRAELDKFVV